MGERKPGDTPMPPQAGPEPPRLRAFTYTRQSRDHEAGIGRQQEDTDDLASHRGYVIPEGGRFSDNDRSASKSQVKWRGGMPAVQLGHRPGYQQMIERVRLGECDVVILTYLDRMRSPDAAEIFACREGAEDVPKLKAERKEISGGLARMAGDEALGILPRPIYLDAAKRVTARLDEIDARIAEAGQMDAAALLIGADDPADIWPDLDVTIQRKIIDSLVHVTLKPPGCGCRNPDMEKLVRVAWRK
jgi:hypothetical protein